MSPMIITFAILLICIIALISNKIPLGLVGIFCPVALSITGVLKTAEAWAGFSNTATVTFAALFVLGGGLAKTSLAEHISNRVLSIDFKNRKNGRERHGLIGTILKSKLNTESTVGQKISCPTVLLSIFVALQLSLTVSVYLASRPLWYSW